MRDQKDKDAVVTQDTSAGDFAFGINQPEVHARDPHKLRKTIGERAYNGIQFWFVKGLILAATAIIGYYGKFGKESNWIKKVANFFSKWIERPAGRLGEFIGRNLERIIGGAPETTHGKIGRWIGAKTHEVIAIFGAAFASTMLLFHGGNIVAPVVMWFENHRKHIIAYFNKHWGKPGDEALGNEKFKDLPRQTAGDTVKGRIVAWLTVFVSFVTGFILAGKVKGTGMYRLSWFEEYSARVITGFKKISGFGPDLGKEIAEIPIPHELANLATEHPEKAQLLAGHERRLFWYKISRILALDFFATSMGIIMWNITSRFSAHARVNDISFFEAVKQHLPWHKPKDKRSAAHEAKILAQGEAKERTVETAPDQPASCNAPDTPLPDTMPPFRSRVASPATTSQAPKSADTNAPPAQAKTARHKNVSILRLKASAPAHSHVSSIERAVEIAQQL